MTCILFNFMLIIDLDSSGKSKEILVSTNGYIVHLKCIYEFLISELYWYV